MDDGVAAAHRALERVAVADVGPLAPRLVPGRLERSDDVAADEPAPAAGDEDPHPPIRFGYAFSPLASAALDRSRRSHRVALSTAASTTSRQTKNRPSSSAAAVPSAP